MSDLSRALLAAMDDADLEELARRLTPHLAFPGDEQPADEWLDMKRAAEYLGITPNALRKHTAARTIPFEQDGPNCKCFFKRSELDEWRRGRS